MSRADLAPGPRASGTAAVLASSALLVAGVLFLGWDVWTVLAVYWLENVALGVFTLPRLALARGPLLRSPGGLVANAIPPRAARLIGWLAVPFFAFHYGMFCLVHGLFVLVILPSSIGAIELRHAFDVGSAPVALEALAANGALIAIAGAVDLRRWMLSGRSRDASVGELMTAPYARVVVLHLALLFGGIAISAVGDALPLLVALILAKATYELRGARAGLAGRTPHRAPA